MTDPTTTAATATSPPRSLNDLPQDTLLHILSFLPTKSAIQASLISRKWRNLWSHLPLLHFPNTSATTPRAALDFINQTLLRRGPSSPLRKFHLQFPFTDRSYASHVDSWARYAILYHASELTIDFCVGTQPRDHLSYLYFFPMFVLKHGNVKILTLVKCHVKIVPISSLNTITLDQVFLTDEMVRGLVSGCVNLERLSLEYCFGMKCMEIRSLKLKKLRLNFFTSNDGSVEVCCPNLESLEMIGFEVQRYELELSGLVEATVFFLHKMEYFRCWSQVVRSLGHVQWLSLQNWWFKDIFSGNFILNNLKHIELRTGYSISDLLGIAALLEHSPTLETMVLDYLCKIDDNESIPEEFLNRPLGFMMPNLKLVKIKDFRAVDIMAFLVKVLIVHGPVLEKVMLVPPMMGLTLVPPTILYRDIKEAKLTEDLAQKISFKEVIEGYGVCNEE